MYGDLRGKKTLFCHSKQIRPVERRKSYAVTGTVLPIFKGRQVPDPDQAFQFNAVPDPAFHFTVDPDPDPAFHSNADPEPDTASKNIADP